jgi:predicted RNA-binding protein with PIN domain
MPTHLLIDGYNFLKRSAVGAFFASDPDGARRRLLEMLAEQRRKGTTRITVVFDAPHGISLSRQREGFRGVDVIYSAQNETADDVIMQVVRRRPSGLVVVSSDRAIIDEAKKYGVTFITSARLEAILEGAGPEEDEPRMEKRGNPRRLPKQLRKARRTIKKI